jgi:hypothetical protein
MKRHSFLFAFGLGVASSLLFAAPASAADHRDGASVLTDPSTDINDVYTWMSADRSKVYLIMTVFPAASKTTSRFSNSAYYVFHTTSRATYTSATATPYDIVCAFDTGQQIHCWFGDSATYLSGDASPTTGLAMGSAIKVFAGPRKDHFFFNLAGFNEVRKKVKANTTNTLNADNCLTVGVPNTPGMLAAQLGQSPTGGAAVDFFASLNTLAIVMEVDTTLLNKGGPLISVWGGTYRKN